MRIDKFKDSVDRSEHNRLIELAGITSSQTRLRYS